MDREIRPNLLDLAPPPHEAEEQNHGRGIRKSEGAQQRPASVPLTQERRHGENYRRPYKPAEQGRPDTDRNAEPTHPPRQSKAVAQPTQQHHGKCLAIGGRSRAHLGVDMSIQEQRADDPFDETSAR